MIARAWFAALVACALVGVAPAHADSDKLTRARDALAAVDYATARDLLASAIEDGGNAPADLAEIYRLAASTAIVLGDDTLAETYDRRWLSLDPDATLTSDAAAKFRDPFIAAQAFVREHGALRVEVGTRDAHAVVVALGNDVLQLAVSAALVVDDPDARVRFDGATPVVLRAPAGQAMVRVYVFDRYGNRVFERSYPSFAAIPRSQHRAATPLFRRWPVWAIPALALGGGAFYFGHAAGTAQDELDAYAGSRGEVYYDEVTAVVHRRDQQRAIAVGLAVGAGACAVMAVVVRVWRPHEPAVIVAPAVTPAGAGVVLGGRF